MDIQLSAPAALETEIRLARPPKAARASDFVSRLQVMQTVIGAEHFAVLRLSGHGLPAARKLTLSLHNWAQDVDGNARALLEAYGAAMLTHLEASMLPLIWEGAGDNQFAESGAEPFTMRLPARLLPWSGIAFPIRLGAHGNGYVVFTGSFIAPSSDLIVDMHMKGCQVLIDMLAGEERKLAPSEALSEREIACLQMAGDGCISEVIAEQMGLSVHTVNAYLGTATTKLDAVNRIQAIAKAIRLGYIT
ncbi:LuxR C-terminal-related transcriptional regulator [Shinella yambaruensis]|uniref:Helix-turn-helix transcriptional regulator n=1 Tax=Shinella yambaruensis TaxID=415996 RepID=A0ABQ5ZF26_9HYPH|nr:helix-turn-helix transcriptional regulator [Shinella yambaruensis]MCJ8026108.1 LuxR C-terminal-related transcriptional regulator [Shinella yambaruensis]MCU7978170.1 LuxR C-terminal-related transcriptional regulator [Shinella yambaruensis]GLR50240.1 helix-turn-helix transcriptional regulator [Shinella yambaruensis]